MVSFLKYLAQKDGLNGTELQGVAAKDVQTAGRYTLN